MDISVVIVSYWSRVPLVNCLEALARTDDGLEYEVVVVDNASGDGTVEAVRARFPGTHVIGNDRNLGFSTAVNQGIAATAGTYVLLLNPDATPRAHALRALRDFLETHPEAGAVGGTLLNGDGSRQPSVGRFPTLRMAVCYFSFLHWIAPNCNLVGTLASWHYDHVAEVDHLGGACILVRRSAIAQIGGMDEGYFLFIEDTDLCYRLRQAGWKVYFTPDAEVVHLGGQSTRHNYVEANAHAYPGLLRFYRRHYGPVRAAILGLVMLGGLAVRYVIMGTARRVRPDAFPHAEREMDVYRRALAQTPLGARIGTALRGLTTALTRARTRQTPGTR